MTFAAEKSTIMDQSINQTLHSDEAHHCGINGFIEYSLKLVKLILLPKID